MSHTSDYQASSAASIRSDDDGPVLTARFKHVITEGGHAIITGRDGEALQRCEDEPIHIPGAVQSFGLLVALQEEEDGKFVVRIVSENSKRIIGYTPIELFSLDSFTDILSEEQTDNLLDHIDFIREGDADVVTNGPELFTISIRTPARKRNKLWCAMHINEKNPDLIICEFELEDDTTNPLVSKVDVTPDTPEDTLSSEPTPEEFAESTLNISRPLRILRSARKRKGEAAAMEVFNIMSQIQEQLASAPTLDKFLKILVGVVKELTGFHRVMIYQFDANWNGRVVTELVDPRATVDLYKGLYFPASDIPKQARDLYKVNRVRLLYDRDQETARLVCRTAEDLETPLDLTYSYLRAMSPIHIKYLANMAVRSSMSISINAFDELWGLISCHSYGQHPMRVSFPIRKMCRLVGDTASRTIERLSYASRLQARKLINTVPTEHNPSGYIVASSEDLLNLFHADSGLLSIRDETKILGQIEESHEALALLEYLRMRRITSVVTSQEISQDFPDMRYEPGFKVIAGLLYVPLSAGGMDFIVFFRKGQLKEVKWAGNPYEKFVREGTVGYLEPRTSFKTWRETVIGKCREWNEDEVETATVLCLVYGKFIEVWRQREAALQNSKLTRLLLANSAHEVRTPLNAIINYLEIALEGALDQETRDNLAKSHSASKSLIYVINDLLDLTKAEEGGELVRGEVFELGATIDEATTPFGADARRKGIDFEATLHPGLPAHVLGDQRKVRQAVSNVVANAVQYTTTGGIRVRTYTKEHREGRADVEVAVEDTGAGMTTKQLDSLFRELEQVHSETESPTDGHHPLRILGSAASNSPTQEPEMQRRTLGLGLAVVARIIHNMNGQLRLQSEPGKGSIFTLTFPFDLPTTEIVAYPPQTPSLAPRSAITPSLETAAEVTLVRSAERSSISSTSTQIPMQRSGSIESAKSGKTVKSFGGRPDSRASVSSRGAGARSPKSPRSEVDRLIEAIQEPHPVTGRSGPWDRAGSGREFRASLSYGEDEKVVQGLRKVRSLEWMESKSKIWDPSKSEELPHVSAIKVADESASPTVPTSSKAQKPPVKDDVNVDIDELRKEAPLNADNMMVLVAEDDPINSRIVQKRMESLGHKVRLTTNGAECADAHTDDPSSFDVVLMDMQMPILDGLGATKSIRRYEKSHTPTTVLSKRAELNGRIPIIAVSASLLESNRQMYIDAGFDAWILKPISFARLNELVRGIVDPNVRNAAVYSPGPNNWERGGWFQAAETRLTVRVRDQTQSVDETRPAGVTGHSSSSTIRVSHSSPELGTMGFPDEPEESDEDPSVAILSLEDVNAPSPRIVDPADDVPILEL
ncbi:hypothetical protein EJ06DRAFT_479867 [Trichodelitschia bisporula]|uniref:Cyanobacterial phytochrome B n=1 Tax=Trichodelitschia bisporula TaxID=703511 RepID=A0A6G1HRL0_9PEZI|nr:hypothetical protein EJ06DRAFT_479867 [Trichodelitschia bisporula]